MAESFQNFRYTHVANAGKKSILTLMFYNYYDVANYVSPEKLQAILYYIVIMIHYYKNPSSTPLIISMQHHKLHYQLIGCQHALSLSM